MLCFLDTVRARLIEQGSLLAMSRMRLLLSSPGNASLMGRVGGQAHSLSDTLE